MLKFILGRASSGKTRCVFDRIKESLNNGGEPILIVPEQFSFESEKAILKMFGDEGASRVSVLPFTRIYETVGRLKGGICGKTLTNADKLILMNRAIKNVSDELTLWGKYADSSVFAEGMINVADEFKYNAISSKDLKDIKINANQKLVNKINDTVKILDSYTALLGSNFIDPSDYMDKLYLALENCDFFKGKEVFFDGFKSFSPQQLKVIDRIIAKAENTTFAFIDDENDKRDTSLLTNIRKTKTRIEDIAKAHNVKIDRSLYLNESHYENADLKAFEECMFTGIFKSETEMPNVTVCRAESIFDEAEFVARNIRRIVREKGAKYSDFVVIARNTETYEDALSIACERNNIKCFTDKKLPLSAMPIASTVISAMEFVLKPTAENLFRFHKSGIEVLTTDELSELENYTFIWNLSGKDFLREWDMNPSGFTDRIPQDIDEKLARINLLREKAVAPLIKFKEKFNGTPKQRITAIVGLIEEINAADAYNNLYEHYCGNDNFEFASAMVTSYSEFMSLLDSIVHCYPDTRTDTKNFVSAIKNAVSFAEIGVTPQTQDEVIFGASDRIRPARPEYAFILGANQGVFPRAGVPTGIFSNLEFSLLKESGLNIPDRTETMAIDEELLVYSNICCASKEVFISFSETLDGKAAFPSAFVEEICSKLKVNIKKEPEDLNDGNLPETLDSVLLEYCKKGNTPSTDRQTLKSVLNDNGKSDTVKVIDSDVTQINAELDKSVVAKIFDKQLDISPTDFEIYSKCKFSYFCSKILKAEKLYPADFNVMQKGSFVHYVLQRVIETYKKDVSKLTKEDIIAEVERFSDEYLDSIKGYRSVETARMKYLVSNIKRALVDIVERLSLEFAQTDFEPRECELRIGRNGKIPSLEIDLEGGNKLLMKGVVDRVDSFGGYVRIIDYKTGSRSFKLPDILVGQNMQMLLYLYAVKQSKKYGDVPTAILYMQAKRLKDSARSDRKMSGLLVHDEEIIRAMEHENNGEFVPKYFDSRMSSAYLSREDFDKVMDYVSLKLKKAGEDIFDGKIDSNPIDGLDSAACKYCSFRSVCRTGEERAIKAQKMTSDEVIATIEKEEF